MGRAHACRWCEDEGRRQERAMRMRGRRQGRGTSMIGARSQRLDEERQADGRGAHHQCAKCACSKTRTEVWGSLGRSVKREPEEGTMKEENPYGKRGRGAPKNGSADFTCHKLACGQTKQQKTKTMKNHTQNQNTLRKKQKTKNNEFQPKQPPF